jgi:hypothetical protein
MTKAQEEAEIALMDQGVSYREVQFLYRIGCYSGFFLQRHFRSYRGGLPGKADDLLVSKLRKLKYVRALKLNQYTLYHLCSKVFYRTIGQPNSRFRRKMSNGLLRSRLIQIEYVMSHPFRYLLTTEEKLSFFCDTLGLSEEQLPRATFRAQNNNAHPDKSEVYFPDKHPMYHEELPDGYVVGYIFGDDPASSNSMFRRWMQRNSYFLRSIPRLHFVFLTARRDRAKRVTALLNNFSKTGFAAYRRDGIPQEESPKEPIQRRSALERADLLRYLRLRLLVEADKYEGFTNADFPFWRDTQVRFQGPEIDHLYVEFVRTGELVDLPAALREPRCEPARSLCAVSGPQGFTFEVCLSSAPVHLVQGS